MGRLQTLWRSRCQKIYVTGIVPTVLWAVGPRVSAQVISAQDSVQTQVVQQNTQFDILGGTVADNATLLFHSFQQFDLEHNQTAEFHVAPGIEAVFSRIINGVPSHINGVIELSNSSASLYLINPAGVLFGVDASINLAGDFTVLTAEQLDFSQGKFGIVGHPDGIEGNILQLHFDAVSPGNIVNLGDLRVGANQSLSLIGHNVVNQGTLRGGAINIAAVGTHETVILEGGLRFTPATQTIQTLPPWLTLTGSEHATAIEVSQDGTLRLTGSPLSELPSGTALVGGQLTTREGLNRIQIVGEHIAIAGARLHTVDGGQMLIGGDYQGLASLPTSQSTVIDAASTLTANGQVGGQIVIWSDGVTQFRGKIRAQGETTGSTVEISGKEQLYFGGQVDLRSQGSPGTLLLDPENIEIRAGRDPGDVNSTEPQVFYEDTLESSIIGDVNVLFQADNHINIEPLSNGELTFIQGTGSISFLADADADGQGDFTMAPGNRLTAPGRDLSITAANITVGDLDTSVFSAIDNAENAGDIYLTATQGNIVSDTLIGTARGTLNNSGNGGTVTLSAAGSVIAEDIITTTNALSNRGSAGEITINAQTGSISTNNLDAYTSGNNNIGTGGDINLSAMSNIIVESNITSASAITNNSGDAGNITLNSQSANIETALLAANTSADNSNTGNGGIITLNALQGTITSQQITTITIGPDLAETQGGDVQLDGNGAIVVDFINAMGQGQGGNINVATQQSFQAVDTIPSTNTSLLTTGEGRIRLTYNSDPTSPFTLGSNSSVNGVAGDIVTDIDILAAPQTVTQPISLNSIELKNLFEPPLVAPGEPEPSTSIPVSQDKLSTSPTVISPTLENLNLLASEATLSRLNNGRHEIAVDTNRERVRAISNNELIWAQIETAFSNEFAKALNLPIPESPSLETTQRTLKQISNAQNINPALMYVRLKDTHVELMLVSSEGSLIYRPVAVTAEEVLAMVETFHQTITNPVLRPAQYLPAAQQLYDWLVRPMLTDLEMANIDHIGFSLDAGLRSLPMAALHDGERFLIESYSIGLLPSVGLTPLEPSLELLSESSLSKKQATLAMGIANFEAHADLAAVPLELHLASRGSRDEQYLDHEATLAALQKLLEQGNFTSVHLATHAVFQPGSLETSYVQLWDQTINLNQLQELPIDTIDFLILSACATALGDTTAEFGFAGLAVNVGVQTALASLWSISDEATLGLMSEFYSALNQPLTRSAALRQAQIAMLRGNVGISGGTVYGSEERPIGHLPSLDTSGSWDFSHPAYWSGFTMIGNPW